jgi:glyoxylase-like metal-dependent hydrolase (beta-lactamase superfamily II)
MPVKLIFSLAFMRFRTLFPLLALAGSSLRGSGQAPAGRLSPLVWQEGELDIHFINTGRGNASLLVMPDGTTLLIDAGDMNVAKSVQALAPLRLSPALPDSSRRPGQWIADYIRQVMPPGWRPALDYVLITHYHGDHYGAVQPGSPLSATGAYRLSGLTDVAEHLPIGTLLDRGYAYPADLDAYYRADPTYTNYRTFARYWVGKGRLQLAPLQAGRADQITLRHAAGRYPSFTVRAIKSNADVWTGTGTATTRCFTAAQLLGDGKKFNENPLSNAIKVTYGPFAYYTGGDNTGYEGSAYPGRQDVETPMAKAIGRVDALTLNHHGNRDATNEVFLNTLAPRVVVEQSWCSDQPGQELAFRLLSHRPGGDSTAVFNLYMQPETQAYLGFWVTKGFKSLDGHVLIRVFDSGRKYLVHVLDDHTPTLTIKQTFGPYLAGAQAR